MRQVVEDFQDHDGDAEDDDVRKFLNRKANSLTYAECELLLIGMRRTRKPVGPGKLALLGKQCFSGAYAKEDGELELEPGRRAP